MGNDQPAGRTSVVSGEAEPVNRRSTMKLEALMALIMALLAIVGTVITIADTKSAEKYWLLLVPVYGFICVYTAWRQTGLSGQSVMRQVLHWLGIALAIAIDFGYLNRTGEETATATGLSTLLILGVGCLLAGVHMEWLFALVGLLLFGLVVLIAVASQYLAVVLVVGVCLAVAAFVTHRFMKKRAAQGTGNP